MGVYGDGHDGNVTISTNTSLSGNMEYENLTVNSGITLNVNDYIVKVSDTLINNGIIVGKVTAGGAGASTKVNTGGTGGDSNIGTAGTNGSGDGGNSGAGGGQWDTRSGGGWVSYKGGNGGAGGDGGFGCGDITIYAYNFNNANTINSSGGDAGNASNGTAGEASCTGGGGGGQGGQGGDAGDISITYENLIDIGTLLRNGGLRGLNGVGGNGSGQGWGYSYTGGVGTGGGDGGQAGGSLSGMIATPGKVGHWNTDGIGGIITITTTKTAPIVTHGIKVIDGANSQILSSELITIISCGTVTMPNSLNGDGTYGYDIDLPGTASIPLNKLGVIILPAGNITWEADGIYFSDVSDPNKRYFPTAYLTGSHYSYYTKDDNTGVMTAFTPGARTAGVQSTWDGIISIFPIFGWDRIGTSLTSIRLWAATCYIILDGMTTTKAVYSIGNSGGITSVNYAVFLKEWDY